MQYGYGTSLFPSLQVSVKSHFIEAFTGCLKRSLPLAGIVPPNVQRESPAHLRNRKRYYSRHLLDDYNMALRLTQEA